MVVDRQHTHPKMEIVLYDAAANMTNQPQRFILQAIDPDLGCPAFEAMFVAERLDELRHILGEAADGDPELEMDYRLETAEVAAISRRFGVPFDPGEREAWLCRWTQRRDEVPYLVHTGYELPLMLEGRKQFARMGPEHYPPHRHWNEDRFDNYVVQGLLHREIELAPFSEPYRTKSGRTVEGLRTVYYTLKGQEWRIDAWKLISKASKEGWNDTLERLEGMLFGYEDWQNDWWGEHLRKQRNKFGTLLVYLAVTTQELAAIAAQGHRSLPPMTRSLKLFAAFTEDSSDDEHRRSLQASDTHALIRIRVKALPFLDLVGTKQAAAHGLPIDRIPELNRLILEAIEVV
jgi:hypothetical protein